MTDPDSEQPFDREDDPRFRRPLPGESGQGGDPAGPQPRPAFPDQVEFGQPQPPPPPFPPGQPGAPPPGMAPGTRYPGGPRYRGMRGAVPPAMHVFYLDLGRVLAQSMNIYFKNIFTFTIVAFLVYLPLLLAGGVFYSRGDLTDDTNAIFSLFIMGADSLLLTWVLTAGLVYGVAEQMRGRRPEVGACVRNAFIRFGPVLLVAILTMLGYALGFVACIFPMFVLMCIWYVAVPVCVVESPGIIASLKRSAELTRGSRLTIIGLIIVLFLIGWAISVVVAIPLGLATMGGAGLTVQFWVTQSVGLFSRSFMAVVPAVVYHELRVGREGADLDELAAVFE